MSTPATSLADAGASSLKRSLNARQCIEIIGRIYIEHDAITHARDVLQFPGLRAREASTGYIVGHSRCGKSETIARHIYDETGIELKTMKYRNSSHDSAVAIHWCEGKGRRILLADMTNGATPLIASRLILGNAFNDLTPSTRTKREAEAAVALIETFIVNKVDEFIVDEAQQMFRGHGTQAIEKMSSWLLPFENAALRSIFVGDTDMEQLHENKIAANLRKGGNARLMPFDFRTPEQKDEFGCFLKMFAEQLPFNVDCLLNKNREFREDMLFPFYFTTRGLPGEIAKLCEHTAYFAADKRMDGVISTVTVEHFAAAFDFNWLNDVRMARFNPFRTDAKKAPDIPLSYQEVAQAQQAARRAVKPSRRPGRQLY